MRINGIIVESLRCYGGYLLVSGICRCGFIEIEILGESMGVEVIDVVLPRIIQTVGRVQSLATVELKLCFLAGCWLETTFSS